MFLLNACISCVKDEENKHKYETHKNSTILLYLVTVHLDNEVVQPPLEVHGLGDCGGDGGLQVWHRQASRVT